jgi:hypothetical protein
MVAAPLVGGFGAQAVADTSFTGNASVANAALGHPSASAPAPRQTMGVGLDAGADATATPAASTSTSGSAAGSASTTAQADAGASTADPTTVSGVAQDLIATIDAASGGGYDIAASPDNVAYLDAWMANEGGLWADNPLNTSLDAGVYPHQITSSGQDTGIPIFPDIQTGVDATATTMLQNRAYAGILAVLSNADASCSGFAWAVMDSPWAASHYGYDPSRFCGSTGGSPGGAQTVPSVTPCLLVPDHGHRGELRSTHRPGACRRAAPTRQRGGGPGRGSSPRVLTYRGLRPSRPRYPSHSPRR